jgi:hypothetical protein
MPATGEMGLMANTDGARTPDGGRLRTKITAVVATIGLAGIAFTISACGGSSSSATTTGPSGSATKTTSTGPTDAQKAADNVTAKASTLKLTDFPTGWVQDDKTSNSGGTCPSVASAKSAASARAGVPTFHKGDRDYVENEVYMYTTVSQAQHAFPELSGSATRECIAEKLLPVLRKHANGKVKFGQPTSGQVSAPPVGDDSVAGRVTVPFTVSGLSFSLNVDLRFVRVSRGIQILLLWTAPGTFSAALESKLTRTAVNRLKAQVAHA